MRPADDLVVDAGVDRLDVARLQTLMRKRRRPCLVVVQSSLAAPRSAAVAIRAAPAANITPARTILLGCMWPSSRLVWPLVYHVCHRISQSGRSSYRGLRGRDALDRASHRGAGASLPGDPRAQGAGRRGAARRRRSRSSRPRRAGALLTDVDGNTFIDFTGGVGCLNVGHSHPKVVAAARSSSSASPTPTSRSSRTSRTSSWPSACSSGRRSPARRRRRSSTPAPRRSRTRSSSRAPTRSGPAVIAFEGGFHGRTLLSLSLTSKTHPYKAGSGRSRPRSTACRSRTTTAGPTPRDALAALERTLVTQVAAETVAAIVVEPVQGEGGFVVAPPEFLEGIRRICDDNGIVLVVDEVQTGFAPHRHAVRDRALRRRARPDHDRQVDRRPGCRSPACSAGPRSWTRPGPNAVGGTYVGNPVAQAAALAVLDVIDEEGLLEPRRPRSARRSRARMLGWQGRFDEIGDVRGLGAMLAIELVHDRESKNPAPELVSAVCERGVPQRAAADERRASTRTSIRVLVPLTIADGELEEALGVWEQALEHVLSRVVPRTRRENARAMMVGEVIADRYELEELVGKGGMSSVYRAHDRLLERTVAIKLLHEHYSARRGLRRALPARGARGGAALAPEHRHRDRPRRGGRPPVHRLRVRRRPEPEAARREQGAAARADGARARRSRSAARSRSRTRAGSSTAT